MPHLNKYELYTVTIPKKQRKKILLELRSVGLLR